MRTFESCQLCAGVGPWKALRPEGAPACTMSVAASLSDWGSQEAQTDGNFLTALTDFASLVQVVPAHFDTQQQASPTWPSVVAEAVA